MGSGLMAKGESLEGFTLPGTDGKYHPARAVIEGSSSVVTSDKVAKPVAVLHGWAMIPEGKLFNCEGLPAAPFRRDPTSDPKRDEEP